MENRTVKTATFKKPPKAGWLEKTLADKTVLLRLCAVALAAETVYLLLQPHLLIQQLHQRERVIVYDPNGPTYSVTPLLSFEEAQELHQSIAMDAASALLNRNPKGLDRDDLMKALFLRDAREKVAALLEQEGPEFGTKNFHQKVNATVETITPSGETVIVTIRGQVIRSGVFNGRSLVETKNINLQLTLLRNPNMFVNKRYPLSVCAFDLKYL